MTDIQLSGMSSRRQSLFPPTLSRLSSFSQDPSYWRQNSSASQPSRRPSEGYQTAKPRLGTDPSDQHLCRSSCQSRPSNTLYRLELSPTLRRSAYKTDKRDTIEEEAPDCEQLHETYLGLAGGDTDKLDLNKDLTSRKERFMNSSRGSSSGLRESSLGRISSLSKQFTDV